MKNVIKQNKIKGINTTRSFNEPFKYLMTTLEEPINQAQIKEIRKTFEIPTNGFETLNPKEHLRFPNCWRYKNNKFKQQQFLNEIKRLCKKLALDYRHWKTTLRAYIFFNVIMAVSKYEYGLISAYDYKHRPKLQNNLYPVVLRISPYASERVILDFIRNMYSELIKPIQDNYRDKNIKIGKIRKREKAIAERNKIIFQNRKRSIKSIRRILAEKHIFLDDGLIGKILSLQKTKRI